MERHPDDDPVMAEIRERWERKREGGMTLQELGEAMGYPTASARKSAWQFLQGHDPRVSMVRRFAEAMGVQLATIVKG